MEYRLVAQTTHCAMGTVMAHKAFGVYAKEALAAVRREVSGIEERLSCFLPESEISRVNRSAGKKSEKVTRETHDVLSTAAEFSRSFPGCFDVTIGPLVSLWKVGKESSVQPDDSSIRQALPLVNYRDLILNPGKRTAGLRNAGQSVDLGAIGKGVAGDKIVEVFKRFGISSAFSNLGGNVVTVGAKPDGSPWQIGIQHPRQQNGLIGSVAVVNQTVVTSGDHQRCFMDSRGKRHHHILDPTTGYPADSGLISVSIVTDRSVAADPLSTIVFVAGMEKGLTILRSFPQTEAILVDSDLYVYVTQGLRSRFQAAKGIAVTILD
ncbi:MAG TPA: FAD:protein FMN transferase [Anaerolineae bacterium]|nr:FAD:protein FMN transferase [Anaerolineae bacterium]